MKKERLYARQCKQPNHLFFSKPPFIEVFSYASRGITTHHSLRTIGIEDAHGEVSLRYRTSVDEHQPVAAYALVAVAPGYGSRRRVIDGKQHGINIDIVVTTTMHFCKFYYFHFVIVLLLLSYTLSIFDCKDNSKTNLNH